MRISDWSSDVCSSDLSVVNEPSASSALKSTWQGSVAAGMPWISRWKPALFAASLHNAFATSGRGLLTSTESRRFLSRMAHTRSGLLPAAASNAPPRSRRCPSPRLHPSLRTDRRVVRTPFGVAYGVYLALFLASDRRDT